MFDPSHADHGPQELVPARLAGILRPAATHSSSAEQECKLPGGSSAPSVQVQFRPHNLHQKTGHCIALLKQRPQQKKTKLLCC